MGMYLSASKQQQQTADCFTVGCEVTNILWMGFFFSLFFSASMKDKCSVTIKMLWRISKMLSKWSCSVCFTLNRNEKLWSYYNKDNIQYKRYLSGLIQLFFVFTENKAFQCKCVLNFLFYCVCAVWFYASYPQPLVYDHAFFRYQSCVGLSHYRIWLLNCAYPTWFWRKLLEISIYWSLWKFGAVSIFSLKYAFFKRTSKSIKII